jgi:hypothetical protein
MALEFSIAGGPFTSTLDIGTIAPSSMSAVVTARRTVPTTEPVRSQALRVSAVAASFS